MADKRAELNSYADKGLASIVVDKDCLQRHNRSTTGIHRQRHRTAFSRFCTELYSQLDGTSQIERVSVSQ